MTPAEQTVIIQRVCGQSDWLKTVHFRENGTPVLICSRELKEVEKRVYGHNLAVEGIPAFDYEVVPEKKPSGLIETALAFNPPGSLVVSLGEGVMQEVPGVTFDPLTGCLTVSPESGVKRVTVPDNTAVYQRDQVCECDPQILCEALCCHKCGVYYKFCEDCCTVTEGCACGYVPAGERQLAAIER